MKHLRILLTMILCLAALPAIAQEGEGDDYDWMKEPDLEKEMVDIVSRHIAELERIRQAEMNGTISHAEAERQTERVHAQCGQECRDLRRMSSPEVQNIMTRARADLARIEHDRASGRISEQEAARLSNLAHDKARGEIDACGESPYGPSAFEQGLIDVMRRYSAEIDKIMEGAASGRLSKDEAASLLSRAHDRCQMEFSVLAAKAGEDSIGPAPEGIDQMNCDFFRRYTLPHSKQAIAKLRSTPEQKQVADLAFSSLGGLDSFENWLDHVCDDDVIDEAEKKQIKILTEEFGLGDALKDAEQQGRRPLPK